MADNLTLGRGELYFDRYINQEDLITRGERYIGHTTSFNLNVESETLDHFNRDRGFNDKDESITISQNFSATFVTDNIDPDNMALYFSGGQGLLSTAAATAQVDVFSRIGKGLIYQLGTSDATPSGVRHVENVVVKKVPTSGPKVNLVAGVDYTVDLTKGRVTLTETGTILERFDTVEVTYDIVAQRRRRIISGREPIGGALRFISTNPLGFKQDYYFPYVKITPNGEFALKGDTWQEIPFKVEVLRKSGMEAIYTDGAATKII